MVSGNDFGYNARILSIKEIDYLMSIVDSSLTDIEKAEKLYAFCNEHTIYKSNAYYKNVEGDFNKTFSRLIKIYSDYDKKGFFDKYKNSYKCTIHEMKLRLKNIIKINDILCSNLSDYNKVYQLYPIYSNSEVFKRAYTLFLKYGAHDERLDVARQALDNFDFLYDEFKKLEERGLFKDIAVFNKIKPYIDNYNFAKTVLTLYVNSEISYNFKEYLIYLDIDEDVFNYCVETIKVLDDVLYNQYLEKKEENKIKLYRYKYDTISDLANGIKTGYLFDGTAFDLIEFIKRVPFKDGLDVFKEMISFMNNAQHPDYSVIVNYMSKNKLNLLSAFKPINVEELYSLKVILNGKELTKEDVDFIINYMQENNIPLVLKAYNYLRLQYFNGEINLADSPKK